MIVSLLLLVLLFAIAIVQSTQGLFSALIMTVLTLCCAAAAFGSHEWIAHTLLAPYWKPDFAHPIALAGMFGVPLIVLRAVFDKVIKRDCLVPAMIGRVGGGICGLVTALVMTGVAAVCLQMIPFGESIFGFSRFPVASGRTDPQAADQKPPPPEAPETGVWLGPDKFAAGLASVLVDGVFSGGEGLSGVYPDFVQAVGWDSFVHTQVSRYSPPNGISIVRTEPVQFVYRFTPGTDTTPESYEAIAPAGGEVFHMIRVQLRDSARDPRKSHIFTLRQFRLVGGADGAERQYIPIAIQQADESQSVNRHIRFVKDGRGDWPVVDERLSPRTDNNNQVEIVFALPPDFEPTFLEYKRGSRAAVRLGQGQTTRRARRSEPPSTAATPSPPAPSEASSQPGSSATAEEPSSRRSARRRRTDDGSSGSRRGGRARRFATRDGRSVFSNDLPMELRSYRGLRNLDVRRGRLRGGHLLAEVNEQTGGTNEAITAFEVPADKRLLQLNVQALNARSGFGKALSFARGVAQNYLVEDANGRQYKVNGKYAVANVNGKEMLEIQFFPNQAGTVGGLAKFQRIDEDDLKRGEHLVLLFFVDPGAEIVAFSTGGSSGKEDIRTQALVAPQ